MKINRKFIGPFFIVISISTMLNILYYFDFIQEFAFQLGYISVIICSVIINISNMRRKQNADLSDSTVEPDEFKLGTLNRCLLTGLAIVWFLTYAASLFLK